MQRFPLRTFRNDACLPQDLPIHFLIVSGPITRVKPQHGKKSTASAIGRSELLIKELSTWLYWQELGGQYGNSIGWWQGQNIKVVREEFIAVEILSHNSGLNIQAIMPGSGPHITPCISP